MDHSPAFLALVEDAKTRIQEISIQETVQKISQGVPFRFIDVREDHEWNNGFCAGAVHLGRGILERDIETLEPDRNAEIALYCGGGFRSALSADNLQKMGYRRVYSMEGGFRKWKELGHPVSKEG